ncbi:MAG: 3-deoxy-D-manno-octulosonate 8-phosphate phosphatase, YrbI family, partial [Verrucomicrobiales bacterium]|nr:3-deoxy-D-manno-octulosonate 8-phosphate phosphatase, YrbI family [Verrucomicrobiales bacterium]
MSRTRPKASPISRTAKPAVRKAGQSLSTAAGLRQRLRNVKLFLCDVDGVLTNGTVLMGGGQEFKLFNIQDGLGLRLLQRHGIKVGWVSNRPSKATQQRAEDLKVDYLFQDKGNKVQAVEAILGKAGLSWKDISYMGDDVVDLGALKRAGLAVAVSNAIDEVKATAHYVTQAHGGCGAVREMVE